MSVNTINHILRRLKISPRGLPALNYTTRAAQKPPEDGFSFVMSSIAFSSNLRLPLNPQVKLDLPLELNVLRKIIESPPRPTYSITDLPKTQIIPLTDKIPENPLEMPPAEIIEKQAARLIVIRRKKMKKHKRKKLEKRMKFVWRRRKQRKDIRKEKAFHAELLGRIKEAQGFDAREYVGSRLQILDNVRIPNKWRGEILPESMIRQFIKEKQDKEWKKLNRPKITLD